MDSNFSNAQPYARNYLWTNIMKWKTKHRINVHTELCTFYSRDWNSMQFTFTYKLEFGPGFANEESIILKEKQKWIIFGFTNIKINISNYAPQKSALFHFHFEHFNLRSHSNCNPICYDWFKIIHAFVLLIELVSFIKSCEWCRAEKNEKKIYEDWHETQAIIIWNGSSNMTNNRQNGMAMIQPLLPTPPPPLPSLGHQTASNPIEIKKNPSSITVFCVHAYTWSILAYEFCGRWIRHCKFVCFSLQPCCECRFFLSFRLLSLLFSYR